MRQRLAWLLAPVGNERGQTGLLNQLIFNPLQQLGSSLLRPVLSGVGQGIMGLLTPQTISQGVQNLLRPNTLLGAGLGLAGAALDREPGEVTQARQFLRGRFADNTLPTQFAQNVSGFSEQFQPLLTQQRQRDIEDISQRFAATFPGFVGAQGPEFGTMARFITDEALPREQALLGQLGLEALNAQERAATTILNANQPNPFAEALGQLGGMFALRDLFGQQGGMGAGQLLDQQGGLLGTVTNDGSRIPLSGQGFQSQLLSAVATANTTGNTGPLLSLLATGALRGTPFPLGLQASTPEGHVIQQAINAGLVESPAVQAVGSGGAQAAAGGAGGISPLLGAGGIALGSGVLGNFIGRQFDSGEATRLKAALAGGAAGGLGGAALGASIGSVGGPVGAVIGAAVGGIAALFGSSSAENARKEAQRQQEAQATAQQRPAALQFQAQSFAELTNSINQLRSVSEQLQPQIEQLLRSDPTFAQVYDQASVQLNSNATNRSIFPTFPLFHQAAELLQGYANEIDPQGKGPEHVAALLASSETGRFGPGVEIIKTRLADTQRVMSVVNRIAQELANRGIR